MSENLTVELLSTFIAESLDFLDEVEAQLIVAGDRVGNSRGGGDLVDGAVQAAFRFMHTIKGNSQIFELNEQMRLAHHTENLLDAIRKGTRHLEPGSLALINECLDLMRELLGALPQCGTDLAFRESVEALVARIDAYLEGIPIPSRASTLEFQDGICWVDAMPATPPSPPSPGAPGAPKRVTAALQLKEELPDLVQSFTRDALALLARAEHALQRCLQSPEEKRGDLLAEAFRAMHSLKGNCGLMGHAELERPCGMVEAALEHLSRFHDDRESPRIVATLRALDTLRQAFQSPDLRLDETALEKLAPEMLKERDEGASPAAPAPESADSPPVPLEVSKGAPVRSDIRVSIGKLDVLVDRIGELVIAEAMVSRCPATLGIEDEHFSRAVHELRRVTFDLQDIAMSIRMLPLSQTFRKMTRLVHDLGVKTGKQIQLDFEGEETEVDKNIIEQVADPLLHLIRNAVDHGLEPAAERMAHGKPPQGHIRLAGRLEGSEVWISVSDDGRGLDREKILRRAIERGLTSAEQARRFSDQEIWQFIFEPGFSTAEKVSDLSGRGVGMDVVKKNIESMKGRVRVETSPNAGTQVILQIPPTLAVLDGMLVRVGSGNYTLPLAAVEESLLVSRSQLTLGPDGQEYLSLRERVVPIVRLTALLGHRGKDEALEAGVCIVVQAHGSQVAFFVDEVMGQIQTVVKPLPPLMLESRLVSGATILGDGTVSLVVDVDGIFAAQERKFLLLTSREAGEVAA